MSLGDTSFALNNSPSLLYPNVSSLNRRKKNRTNGKNALTEITFAAYVIHQHILSLFRGLAVTLRKIICHKLCFPGDSTLVLTLKQKRCPLFIFIKRDNISFVYLTKQFVICLAIGMDTFGCNFNLLSYIIQICLQKTTETAISKRCNHPR